MAPTPRVLIAGGAGVFGRSLARELLERTSAELILAGRNVARLEDACRRLGGRTAPAALDLEDAAALERAARGCAVVACAAGPFQGLRSDLPRAALVAGAHWLDIADASDWVLGLLRDAALHADAAAAGRVVVPGSSTVPALSGVLARHLKKRLPDGRRLRVTLAIGGGNPKGAAAVASALRAPLDDPLDVEVDGRSWRAYRFKSPDEVLLPAELGLSAEFRVAFEMPLTVPLLRRVRALAGQAGQERLARLLVAAAAPMRAFGRKGGGLQAELASDTELSRAALVGAGQRMAVLPCAIAIGSLLDGDLTVSGVQSPATLFDSEAWLGRLAARGLRLAPHL